MLKPDYIMNSVTDITTEFLKKHNFKAVLLDVDNTLSAAHGNKSPKNGVLEWINRMRQGEISLMILSNAKVERVESFAEVVGLPVVGMAAKPLPFGYKRAIKVLKVPSKEVLMVGDQVFTDILGGNLAGVKTLLVTDITPENKLHFKIKRFFERIMLKRWKR